MTKAPQLIGQLSKQLASFLPTGTEALCAQWLIQHRVNLRIARPRKTILGDFRPAQGNKPHRISVNKDLNPLQFLITFAHEIAHVQTWERFRGYNVAPHGKEWKACYQNNLRDILALDVLPLELTQALRNHSRNPKASSAADPHIHDRMTPLNTGPLLNHLTPGDCFSTAGGKAFRTVRRLRTYWLCQELVTDKHYRVPGATPVVPVKATITKGDPQEPEEQQG